MLGGPWGPRLTEENSEEREPLGVKCVWVCGCVCMCEREGGQCYFNPELTSGCSTPPLLLQSVDSSINLPAEQLSCCRFHFPSSPLLSFHLSRCFSPLSFLFFSLAPHRYTGVALPAPLRAGVLSDTSGCIVRWPCCLCVRFPDEVTL